jgi:hypothetical protein
MFDRVSTEAFPFPSSATRTFVHSPVSDEPGRLVRDWETGFAESAVGGTVWGSRQCPWISARPRVWRRRLEFLLCESLFMLLATIRRVTELLKITAGLLPRLDYRGRWSSESFSAPGILIDCFLIRQKSLRVSSSSDGVPRVVEGSYAAGGPVSIESGCQKQDPETRERREPPFKKTEKVAGRLPHPSERPAISPLRRYWRGGALTQPDSRILSTDAPKTGPLRRRRPSPVRSLSSPDRGCAPDSSPTPVFGSL